MKKVVLVLGIAVLLMMTTAYAVANPNTSPTIENFYLQILQKLDEIKATIPSINLSPIENKLDEIKLAIQGIEIPPIDLLPVTGKLDEIKTAITEKEIPLVDISPISGKLDEIKTAIVEKEITIPEKVCQLEYGTETIPGFSKPTTIYYFTVPDKYYNNFALKRALIKFDGDFSGGAGINYIRFYLNDQLIYEDWQECGGPCTWYPRLVIDTTDPIVLSKFNIGINKLEIKLIGLSGSYTFSGLYFEYQNIPANC